jgi:hypothetical protein
MPASPDRCGGGHLTELQMWGKSWGKGKEKEQDQITSVSEMWERVLKFLDISGVTILDSQTTLAST